MLEFWKKNKYFLLGVGLLFFVILVNLFPKGYVFGGGDTNQIINAKDYFSNLFYYWETRALLFYSIFVVLDIFHISESGQLSWYLGIFLISSYLSFFLFAKLIFKSTQGKSVLASLFYALNLYTLFVFTGNWGYSYFPTLYMFLPLLAGFFIRFLKTKENLWGALFVLTLFLGSSGFGNPAFFMSFIIFLLFLLLALWIFRYIRPDRAFILKLSLLAVFSLLVSASWLLPLFPEVKGGIASLSQSTIVDFDSWIRHTASPIEKTLSLNQFSEDYFPYNFYYKNWDFLEKPFLLFSFLPIVVILAGIHLKNKLVPENKKLLWVFLFVLIIFTLLVARIVAPFETINYYIYHLPGFVALRGYDKTMIFIPFLLAALLLIAISHLKNKRILTTLFSLILILPLPFFVGKIQQTAGYRVNSKNDYQKASMSFLVKIPSEYYSIQKIINTDPTKTFIATLPTTYSDGSGIVYYPKWNFYGTDITRYLYNKNLIEANGFYFPNWNFAQSFEKETADPDWLPKLLGIMDARYAIFHKDAPEESVQKNQPKMEELASAGLLRNIADNDYFTLYEINPAYRLPYISYQKEIFAWRNDPVWIGRNAEKIIADSQEARFKEINPKKFEVDFQASDFSKNIILAENFNPNWKAYAVLNNGDKLELQDHFVARGYANGWKIDNTENISRIIIEYYPIQLLWWGIWMSGLTVLFLLGYLVKYYYNKCHSRPDRESSH